MLFLLCFSSNLTDLCFPLNCQNLVSFSWNLKSEDTAILLLWHKCMNDLKCFFWRRRNLRHWIHSSFPSPHTKRVSKSILHVYILLKPVPHLAPALLGVGPQSSVGWLLEPSGWLHILSLHLSSPASSCHNNKHFKTQIWPFQFLTNSSRGSVAFRRWFVHSESPAFPITSPASIFP